MTMPGDAISGAFAEIKTFAGKGVIDVSNPMVSYDRLGFLPTREFVKAQTNGQTASTSTSRRSTRGSGRPEPSRATRGAERSRTRGAVELRGDAGYDPV